MSEIVIDAGQSRKVYVSLLADGFRHIVAYAIISVEGHLKNALTVIHECDKKHWIGLGLSEPMLYQQHLFGFQVCVWPFNHPKAQVRDFSFCIRRCTNQRFNHNRHKKPLKVYCRTNPIASSIP